MKQYISKSDLVAEIEKRIKEEILSSCVDYFGYSEGKVEAFRNTLSFIDTLEVKEVDLEKEWDIGVHDIEYTRTDAIEVKEVDLEEEVRKWQQKHFEGIGYVLEGSGGWIGRTSLFDIAEHFYELGLNTERRKL